MKTALNLIVVLLVLCPIGNYASPKPNEDKLRLSFRVLDENFSLNNRTHRDLRRNQSLLLLAESAVSAAAEFYKDDPEFLHKSIRTLYVEGNFYLHTEKSAIALQKLTLAKELCESLPSTDPTLPALYSLVLHHLGLYHLGQIAINPKALAISSEPAEKYLKNACEIRDAIDASKGSLPNVADNNTAIGDAVIFKRNLGHFYFETNQLDEAEKIYLALLSIDDQFNQLLVQRQLLKVYQRKAQQSQNNQLYYQKAMDAAHSCLDLIENHVGRYTRVATVFRDIGNLYSDPNNPFQNIDLSLDLFDLAKEHCPDQLRVTSRYIKEGLSLALTRLSEKERQEADSLRWAVTEEDNANFLKLLDDQKLHVLNYEMLGDLYLEKKSYILASALYSNALSLSLYVPDTLPFQERLYHSLALVESLFLQEHNLPNPNKNIDSYRLSLDTLKRYQTSLELLREEAKYLLKNNQSIEAIYSLLTQKYKQFIQTLIQETIFLLGPPPTEDFAFVAFGSLGRGIANPYSDLEFAILLKDEKHAPYFKTLSELFHIRITALGEAPIGSFKIQSLNWLTVEDGPSGWGLMLDSGNIVPHIPLQKNFELIGTPHHLASIFDPSYDAIDTREKTSFYISALLYGKHDLHNQYQQEVDKLLDENNLRSQLVDRLLQEDLDNYYKNLGDQWLKKWGQTFNVKHDFYRPFMILLDTAAFQHGLRITSPWQIINDLHAAQLIDDEAHSIFKNALNEIAHMRLESCIKYKKQSYMMYPDAESPTKYFVEYEKIAHLFDELFTCQKKL